MTYTEKINKYKLNIECLSEEALFEYFVFGERKMLSLVDGKDVFIGIITLGDFQKHAYAVREAINRNGFKIVYSSKEKMFLDARSIYEKHQIESDLPVVDKEGKLIGHILNEKPILLKKEKFHGEVKKLKEKIIFYKKSVYLRNELDAFVKLLERTKIYVRNLSVFSDIFSMIDSKLCLEVIDLSNEEYLNMIRQYNKYGKSDLEGTSVLFDFDINNQYLFSKQWGYDISKFSYTFCQAVEHNEFSRIINITDNSYYTLKDCIDEFEMESISFTGHHLMTKYISDYLKREGYLFSYNSDAYWGIKGSCIINNVCVKEPIWLVAFWYCDMILQQIKFWKKVKEKGIRIFNVRAAVKAKVTKNEEFWIKNQITTAENLMTFDKNALKTLYELDTVNEAEEYIKKIMYGYPIRRRMENDLFVNVDYKSELVNIEGGIRKTCYQPQDYDYTIYFFGPCMAVGAYVEDKDTIPSLLSKILIEKNLHYRVVNLGVFAANDCDTLLKQLDLKRGDIVINLITSNSKVLEKHMDIVNVNEIFDAIPHRKDMFIGTSAHCAKDGNRVYAEIIYKQIRASLQDKFTDLNIRKRNESYTIFKPNYTDLNLYGYDKYLDMLKREKNKILGNGRKIGSIVMNANPFTIGHKYLVEYALKCCEWLYLFVVQEDSSFFSFEDRFAMVVNACKDIKNISILPSGKMIASKITFPTYFQREKVRNFEEEKLVQTFTIEDLRVFATYITAELGIKMRFVGEEPLDLLTRQYNVDMKKVLSTFGIDVIEIPRMRDQKGKVVSASSVRQLYRERKFEQLKVMVPNTTYQHLLKRKNDYLKNVQ